MSTLVYNTPNIANNMYRSILYTLKTLLGNGYKVITEYPQSMKDLTLPCICVRIVSMDRYSFVDGGVINDNTSQYNGLGSFTRNVLIDVQIDCVGGNQAERLVLTDAVNLALMQMGNFNLMNFASNRANTPYGEKISMKDTHSEFCCVNSDQQYINAIRQRFACPEILIVEDADHTSKDLYRFTQKDKVDDTSWFISEIDLSPPSN